MRRDESHDLTRELILRDASPDAAGGERAEGHRRRERGRRVLHEHGSSTLGDRLNAIGSIGVIRDGAAGAS